MNKTIWMMWLQGWDSAPEISQKCYESWEFYNPEWKVIQLDATNYTDYIDPFDIRFDQSRIGKDQYSDFIRTFLLEKHGGVWADATLWCNSPLDTWLPENDFLFSNPRPSIRISNWFISKYDGKIIDHWAAYVRSYLNQIVTTQRYPSGPGWHHSLFETVYQREPSVKKNWDSYHKLSSQIHTHDGPHKFTPYPKHFNMPISDQLKNDVLNYDQPMYKLSHKVSYIRESVVPWLFTTLDKRELDN